MAAAGVFASVALSAGVSAGAVQAYVVAACCGGFGVVRAVACAGVGMVVLWPRPALLSGRTMGLLILVMYGFLVVNYLGWFLIRRAIVVQVRRARECEFELCSDCLYSLHGLPPEGKCPECGREIALSVECWRMLVAKGRQAK